MRRTCDLDIAEVGLGVGFNDPPQSHGVCLILELPVGVAGEVGAC